MAEEAGVSISTIKAAKWAVRLGYGAALVKGTETIPSIRRKEAARIRLREAPVAAFKRSVRGALKLLRGMRWPGAPKAKGADWTDAEAEFIDAYDCAVDALRELERAGEAVAAEDA